VAIGHAGGPIAQCLVDGILECARPGIHRAHLCAQETHASDVGRLAGHVLCAHIHHALHAEQRGGRGRGDAVLARARLRDEPAFAHGVCQKPLPQGVVDLVRTGVGQVFPLEPDAGPAAGCAQATRLCERRGSPHIVAQEPGQLGLEGRILSQLAIRLFELLEWAHERLWYKASSIGAIVTPLIRQALPRAIIAHSHGYHAP